MRSFHFLFLVYAGCLGRIACAEASVTPAAAWTPSTASAAEAPGEYSLGLGAFFASSDVTPGISLGGAFPLGNVTEQLALFVGIELGLYSLFQPNFSFSIPLMLKLVGKYRMTESANLCLGLAAGPIFGLLGSTSTQLLALLEPSLEWLHSPSVTFRVEPRFGLLAGNLVFAPRLALAFPL